jgi:DNA-directed RNA polymerase subunit RPC12/RpoP
VIHKRKYIWYDSEESACGRLVSDTETSFQWRDVTCPECRLVKDRNRYEKKFKKRKK